MASKKVVVLAEVRKRKRRVEAKEELTILEAEIARRPHLGLRAVNQVAAAKKILIDGLKYHEHDGHNMPKRVARDALEALGVKRDDQP